MDKQSLVLTLVRATTARIKKNSALLKQVNGALEEHEKSVLCVDANERKHCSIIPLQDPNRSAEQSTLPAASSL